MLKLDTPLHSVPIGQLKPVLENMQIEGEVKPGQFSDVVISYYNKAKEAKWLIFLDKHPARLVVYSGTHIRFNFPLENRPFDNSISIRKLKLRKLYPQHCIRVRLTTGPTKLWVVYADIKHTAPISALVDSLRASEKVWEELNNDR
ncbi:MAG: hypothetical protein PHI24_08760 [Desulfitobacteriaceae bacterium]|nr:hypothetical protein [Desulfitobacteriaceae bacterium]